MNCCSISEERASAMTKIALIALPLVAIFCVCLAEVTSTSGADRQTNVRRVIVDVDAGPDDAWALFHLLSTPGVRVEAISCVKGNTNVTNVGRNVLRVLTLLGKHHEVPIYLGSNERLITPGPTVDPNSMYFGSDGFSDIKENLPEVDLSLLKNSALEDLSKLIAQHANEISFITLGPLTNLALLFKVYPETRQRLREIFVMGGNRHGVGNTEKAAEFNFYNDPEAANIVVNNFDRNITVLPWETASLDHLVTNQTWRFDVLGKGDHPVVQMLNPAEKKPLTGNGDNWMPCDLLVAMAFTNPELVTERKIYRGNVELHGWLTRGQLVLDHANQGQGNIVVIDNMDSEKIADMLMKLASAKIVN